MQWTVTYYSEKVAQEIQVLPDKLQAKCLHTINMIELHGPDLGLPFTRSMGAGLFEIRAKSHEGIVRAFFCTLINKEVVILHSFIKKTDKTPRKELEKARKRMEEIKKTNG